MGRGGGIWRTDPQEVDAIGFRFPADVFLRRGAPRAEGGLCSAASRRDAETLVYCLFIQCFPEGLRCTRMDSVVVLFRSFFPPFLLVWSW